MGPQRKTPRAQRAYRCRCGRPVFFRNSFCLNCDVTLGYAPDLGGIYPLVPAGENSGTWRVDGQPQEYLRCANHQTAAGCNWILPASEAGFTSYCIACRLNRTIPDLSYPGNGKLWNRIEVAKRRLVSSLVALGLPVKSRVIEDPASGLAFDFLRSPVGGPRVVTGHAGGLITLDIEEADDATRERIRAQMHEPYRTLLGHLRHEVGHYYWDRLIRETEWLERFRELFGDEREDYAAALHSHYERGPAVDWQQNYVSAYASSHPWEDWAESWAHYLHIVDTLDTALSFGLNLEEIEIEFEPFVEDSLYDREVEGAGTFLSYLNSWTELTAVLNEFARSMGQPDLYPFVLSRNAVSKLHFIHLAVESAGNGKARGKGEARKNSHTEPPPAQKETEGVGAS